MSDEYIPEAEAEELPEAIAPAAEDYLRPDWTLQVFVDLLESTGVTFGLCLQIGGLVVAGDLVTGQEYFRLVQEKMTAAVNDEGKESVAAYFGGFTKKAAELANDPVRSSPTFIHLKNARVFHPGGPSMPSNQPVPWRGRLAAVDAYWIGSLHTSSR